VLAAGKGENMDKQTQRITEVKNGVKILMWLGLLIFFVYSLQTIVDWESIGGPQRNRSIVLVLTALSKPNLFEYEYETRETPVALEKSCQNPDDLSQAEQVGDRTIGVDLECPRERKTIYTIRGSGFQPNTAGYVAWKSNTDNENWKFRDSDFLIDTKGNFSITATQIDMENVLSGRTIIVVEQFSKTFRGFSETSHVVTEKLWETIQIAFLATVIGAILAIPFTFFSARASSCWEGGFNILLQPLLAMVRSIHPLIIVMFAIVMVGIGPTAGVLALTLFSTAVLTEKFSEYAREHTSLSWTAMLTVHFPGLAFRHFPVNFVMATVIGFMGGGGIGFLVQQNINLLNYRAASVSLLAIIVAGGSLDLLSRAVWHKIQGFSGQPHPIAPEKVEIASQI
jgi:phosphonate transport system permease protein